MSDNDIGRPAPQLPPGRCNACHQDVDVRRLFEKGQQPGVKFHRDHVGQPCGPVLTKWAYRVIAWIQPPGGFGRPKSYVITRIRPMLLPSDYLDVANFLTKDFTAVDGQGAALVGVKPEIEVLFAELVAAS